MICQPCIDAAEYNRFEHDKFPDDPLWNTHPENCGCYCQHRPPKDWDAMYSVERPDVS